MAEVVLIDHLNADGSGGGTLATGKPVAAWGSLPGETVGIKAIRRQKGVVVAHVESVLQPSPHRQMPVEEHYLSCSPWQIMSRDFERLTKETIVRNYFQARGIVLPHFLLQEGEESFGYRNKMEFSFTANDSVLSLAFFTRGGKHKIPISECQLAASPINGIAQAITRTLQGKGVLSSSIKSLIVRCNKEGKAIAGLFLKDRLPLELRRQDIHPSLLGLTIVYSDPRSPASRVTSILADDGATTLRQTLNARAFSFGLHSFFQVNIPMFTKALAAIATHAPGGTIVDLYAGVGTIGLSLPSASLTLVEIDPHALPFLRENAISNRRADAIIRSLAAEQALDEITASATVILDPPRAGLHPRVTRQLCDTKPQTIIYLSCNPETQARDIEPLLASGYALVDFQVYNFFPRTPHIEALAVLRTNRDQ